MRFNILRSRAFHLGVAVPALAAIALAYFFLPLHRPVEPAGPRLRISTPPGSAARLAKLETDLRALQAEAATAPARPAAAEAERQLQALQAEAAKDPARPTVAEIGQRLDRMVKQRNAPGPGIARLERLVTVSLGLTLILGGALLATTLGRLFRREGRTRSEA